MRGSFNLLETKAERCLTRAPQHNARAGPFWCYS
jgi:hypothetical protein